MGQLNLRILLLNLIITIISSQYIITSNNYASVIRKVEALYLKAMEKEVPSSLEKTVFAPIIKHYYDKSIEITDIAFKELAYDKTHPYIRLEHNIISYSPNLINTVFTLKYKIDGSNQVDALLSFTIYNLIIEEREDKKNHNPDVRITIEDKEGNYIIKSLDPEVEEVPEIILNCIKEYFPSINFHLIQQGIASAINKYHIDDLAKVKTFWFQLSSPLHLLNVNNDMSRFTGFCTDMGKEKKTGQCFHSGNMTTHLDFNIKKDSLSIPTFVSDTKYFQIFINFKMIQEVFNFVSDLKIPLTLNEKTKPLNYPYQFIVANLIPYFPSLASLYIGRCPITINTIYSSLQILDKSTIKVNFAHSIKIKESDDKTHDNIIKFESELVFEFEVIYFITNINLCLKKLKAINVQVVTGDNQLNTLVNLQGFKTEYAKIISLYLKQKPICFTKEDGFNLDDHIKFIDFAEVNDKGIYLKGKSIFE